MNKPLVDFFNKEAAEAYDERNSKLASISNTMHFLLGLILKDLPSRSRILCVGAGTGAEILFLSKIYPEWTFLALDPSEGMLNVCRDRLSAAGVDHRCEFFHGYVQDLPCGADFDATLAILVAHFVKRDEKVDFFGGMAERLKKGGYLVNVEISFDLDSTGYPLMLKNWESIQTLMGATAESLAKLPSVLKDVLSVMPPAEIGRLIRLGGIDNPVQFFQAFMICGWYGMK